MSSGLLHARTQPNNTASPSISRNWPLAFNATGDAPQQPSMPRPPYHTSMAVCHRSGDPAAYHLPAQASM
jgi:hypothetical protein